MKLLIVAATLSEISESVQHLEDRNIKYLITGVGMVATAYAMGKFLAKEKVDLVINVGIGGSFDTSIKLGSLIQIAEDSFSELGAEDHQNFISIDELGFGNQTFRNKKNINFSCSLPTYSAITVNSVHGNEDSIKLIRKRFPQAAIESMEGAAVFYACEHAQVPCLQIRAISNYVEPRNRNNWNIPLAIKNLNLYLKDLLTENLTD